MALSIPFSCLHYLLSVNSRFLAFLLLLFFNVSSFARHHVLNTTIDSLLIPDWSLGASKAVNIIKPVNSVWTMDTGDTNDDDLVDENELFNDNIEVKKVSGCDGEPAEPGSRRACKNCSCGLKEEEDAAIEAGIKLDPNDVKSACGNCSKGDAFRCAGCPSRGKAAWNVDENTNKVMVNMDDDI